MTYRRDDLARDRYVSDRSRNVDQGQVSGITRSIDQLFHSSATLRIPQLRLPLFFSHPHSTLQLQLTPQIYLKYQGQMS